MFNIPDADTFQATGVQFQQQVACQEPSTNVMSASPKFAECKEQYNHNNHNKVINGW